MVANINWVTDLLATGGDLSYNDRLAGQQIADIIKQDVRLIVDLRPEADDADVWAEMGVDYLHLPTDDRHGHSVPRQLFDRLVAKALPRIEAGEKVLVHCHMGINRGPSGAFALMLAMGHDPIEAFDLIREKRPEAYIAYAKDALRAHNARLIAASHDEFTVRRIHQSYTDFGKHLKRVNTPAVERNVRHIIRKNHARDQAEYMDSVDFTGHNV